MVPAPHHKCFFPLSHFPQVIFKSFQQVSPQLFSRELIKTYNLQMANSGIHINYYINTNHCILSFPMLLVWPSYFLKPSHKSTHFLTFHQFRDISYFPQMVVKYSLFLHISHHFWSIWWYQPSNVSMSIKVMKITSRLWYDKVRVYTL